MVETSGIDTPLLSSTYPPLITNPPSSLYDPLELDKTISDPLGLGNLRNGHLLREEDWFVVDFDEEFHTNDDSGTCKEFEVYLQSFFMLGRLTHLIKYDDSSVFGG